MRDGEVEMREEIQVQNERVERQKKKSEGKGFNVCVCGGKRVRKTNGEKGVGDQEELRAIAKKKKKIK